MATKDKSFELRQDRAKLIHDARLITENAAETRSLSAEDKAQVDKIMEEVNNLDELIEKLDAVEKMTAAMPENEPDGDEVKSVTRGRKVPEMSLTGNRAIRNHNDWLNSAEYRSAYKHWLVTGERPAVPAEFRDVILGTNSSGGYLVTPTQISDDIVMIINNLCFMRELSQVETVTTAASLGVRQMTTQPSDASWTTEIGSISADSTMAFGRRDLTPQLLVKGVNVSIRMLEASPDVEGLVKERIGYKFATAEENGFLNGSGSGQPLGVFTADANGVTTTRDYVCTDASSTVIKADYLVGAKYNMKQNYLASPKAAWIFNRVFVSQIRTLKDQYGRYLWADGGGFNQAPDTILGIPVKVSEYAPSTATSGSYVGILGNFDYYRIAQVRDLQIQRLVELYAGNSEVGFIGRRWVDGSPVLAEAFTRLKIA